MSRKYGYWFCWMGCCLLTGCSDDANFERWVRDWEKAPATNYPASAEETPPDAAALLAELEQYRALAATLNNIEPSTLETANKKRWSDYAAEAKQALESRESLEVNPAAFNIGESLSPLFGKESGDAEARLQRLEKCLEHAPAYYETAKQWLRRPNPELTLSAIDKQLHTLRLLRDSLPALAEEAAPDKAFVQRLAAKSYRAKLAVKDYLAFCESLHFEHSDTTLVRRLAR